MRHVLGSLVLLSVLAPTARASTVLGNPTSGVVIGSGDDIYVHALVATRCSSGAQTITVAVTLDKGEEEPITFDQDDFCSMTAWVRWTPAGSVQAVTVTGFTTLSVDTSGDSVAVVLDGDTSTAVLVVR